MAWPNGQTRRVELVVPNAQVSGSGTHSNFQVLITRANLPNEVCSPTDSNRAQSDGGDIRAAATNDCTGQFPIDIVSFEYDTSDGAGDAQIEIWVKCDLATATDTSIWLAYNTAGTTSADAATDTYGRNAVWSDYVAVYHMAEDPSGSAPQMVDSTGNGFDGTSSGSMVSGDLVSSAIGNGLNFNGTSQAIDLGGVMDVASYGNYLTVSAWANWDGSGIEQICSHHNSGGDAIWQFRVNNGALEFIVWNNSASLATASGATSFGTNNRYAAGVFNGSNVQVYLDGAADDGTPPSLSGTIRATTFGDEAFIARSETVDPGWWTGDIDEVRITALARSADWIATEYANQSSPSTFIVEGTPQSISGGTTHSGAISVSGSGSVVAAGSASFSAAGSFAGSGAIAFAGVRNFVSASSFSGSGSLTGAGVRNLVGGLTLVGSGTMASAAVGLWVGAGTFAGTGNLVAAGNIQSTLYQPQAVEFDGTNDYGVRGADLTGSADSKVLTFSFWLKYTSGSFVWFSEGGTLRMSISGGALRLLASNSSASTILSIDSGSGLDDGSWHHLCGCVDMVSISNTFVYIDDVDVTGTPGTFVDDTIDFTVSNHGFGASTLGTLKLDACVADFWLALGTYVDLSVESNRRKFVGASAAASVDLGDTGELPTGSSPSVYFSRRGSDTPDDFLDNKGTGGVFTLVGSLDACATAPPTSDATLKFGSIVLTCVGSISVAGGNTYVSAASLAGSGSVTSAATTVLGAHTALMGSSTLVADAVTLVQHLGAVILTGTSGVSAAPIMVFAGGGTFSGEGSLVALGGQSHAAGISLTGTGSILATAKGFYHHPTRKRPKAAIWTSPPRG